MRSIALAKSPLPSARKSILSAPVAFFQASMTNTSLTDVTATVLTPFALIASACCVIEGTCILWQVPVKAPGTANNATFLPLKISSVVFHAGPSAVITRNFVSGSRTPTLIGMTVILSLQLKPQREHQISAAGGLFQRQAQSSGAATSMASSAVTAVTVTTAPS